MTKGLGYSGLFVSIGGWFVAKFYRVYAGSSTGIYLFILSLRLIGVLGHSLA
jgi:hypothetical protein